MSRFQQDIMVLGLDDTNLRVEFLSNGCVWIKDLSTNNKVLLGETEFRRLLIASIDNRSNHNVSDL
jgi:hypothetical protein